MNTSKPLKLHKPLLDAVSTGLIHIFKESSYADKEVHKILTSNRQFGSKDRSFIAETIYDIVRWKLNYEEIASALKLNETWRSLIFVSLMKRNCMVMNPEMLEVDIDALDLSAIAGEQLNDSRMSFPKWIDERCSSELGNKWNTIAEALNNTAPVYIRVNTLKTSAEIFLKLLHAQIIEARLVDPVISKTNSSCIEILSKNNLRNSAFYRDGLFEFQDIGSQAIGNFCNIKPGQTVIDLCAGAGGKTLHLSALMNNTGIIYATDHKQERLDNLEKRIRQAGCRNVKIVSFHEAKKINDADLMLIDAPCSGLGTIRRHPDIKWKLQPENLERYISIQATLLEQHRHQVKAGGRIVYATCSILPSESEEQVQKFLKKFSSFSLEKELRIHPHEYNSDGFYMAEIIRNS